MSFYHSEVHPVGCEGARVPEESTALGTKRQSEDGEMGLGLSRVSGSPAPGKCGVFYSCLCSRLSSLHHGFLQGPAPWGCVGHLPLPSLPGGSDQAGDHG